MIKGLIRLEDITIVNIYAPDKKIPKINEAKTHRIQGQNRQFNNNSWRLQHPTFIIDKTTRQKVNKETEEHYKLTIPNRHIENTSSNNSRIHILLDCTWDIFHDGLYDSLQNNYK